MRVSITFSNASRPSPDRLFFTSKGIGSWTAPSEPFFPRFSPVEKPEYCIAIQHGAESSFGTFLVAHFLEHCEPLVAVVELRAEPLLPQFGLHLGPALGQGGSVHRKSLSLILLVHVAPEPGTEVVVPSVFQRGPSKHASERTEVQYRSLIGVTFARKGDDAVQKSNSKFP